MKLSVLVLVVFLSAGCKAKPKYQVGDCFMSTTYIGKITAIKEPYYIANFFDLSTARKRLIAEADADKEMVRVDCKEVGLE